MQQMMLKMLFTKQLKLDLNDDELFKMDLEMLFTKMEMLFKMFKMDHEMMLNELLFKMFELLFKMLNEHLKQQLKLDFDVKIEHKRKWHFSRIFKHLALLNKAKRLQKSNALRHRRQRRFLKEIEVKQGAVSWLLAKPKAKQPNLKSLLNAKQPKAAWLIGFVF